MSLTLSTLSDLRTEFLARGFSYLSTTRANRYISLGYFQLCDEFEWPFLEATTSGVTPLTISDLNKVESVVNTTSELKIMPLSRRVAQDLDPALDDTGTAEFYYIRGGSTTAIKTYPENTTDTFIVRYWKFPGDLTSDSVTILVPERWRYLIIEAACRKAYQDSDNPALSQMCREEYESGLMKMIATYDIQQFDRPDEIQVVASTIID